MQAMLDDGRDSVFQEGRKTADAARQRALYLAGLPEVGIPPDGASYILRRDPLFQGGSLLERRCLGCHVLDGKGAGTQTASDLKDFGTRQWVRGLLENPSAPAYFGTVKKFGGMKEWKRRVGAGKGRSRQGGGLRGDVCGDSGRTDACGLAEVARGRQASRVANRLWRIAGIATSIEGLTKGGMRKAPQIFGWGSSWWIARMIRNPRSSDKYGFLDPKHPGQMPAFGEDQVSASDLETLIRYLKGDYPQPAGAVAAH